MTMNFAMRTFVRYGRTLKTADELEHDLKRIDLNTKIIDNRSRFPIVVIDDKDFTPMKNLQRYNFSVTHFDDISSIDSIYRYPIVLCDLHGVGASLGSRLQGAQVIREIKKNYPEKYVIAYTGDGSSEMTEVAISYADAYLKKDVGI